MSVSSDRWTCPSCGRSVVVNGSDADIACSIEACQRRHAQGHAAADAVLVSVGLAGAANRAKPRRRRARGA